MIASSSLSINTMNMPMQMQMQMPMTSNTTTADSEHGITSVDVLCGRDKRAFNNVGNRRMRVLVSMLLPKYLAANSRQAKSLIIKELAESIRDCGGRFLKWSPSLHAYQELSDKKAHEKCSHAFRDMVSARSHAASSSCSSSSSTSSCHNASHRQEEQPKKNAIATTAPRTLVPFHIEYPTSTPKKSSSSSSAAPISEDEESLPRHQHRRRASRMSFADTNLTFCPVNESFVCMEPLALARAVSEESNHAAAGLAQEQDELFLLENESVLSDLLEDEEAVNHDAPTTANAIDEDGDLIKGLLLQL